MFTDINSEDQVQRTFAARELLLLWLMPGQMNLAEN
jgi:hypothetical protein